MCGGRGNLRTDSTGLAKRIVCCLLAGASVTERSAASFRAARQDIDEEPVEAAACDSDPELFLVLPGFGTAEE